jgi:hypothetical protein
MIRERVIRKVRDRIISDLNFLVFYTKSKIVKVDGDKVKNSLTIRNYKCHCNSYDKYVSDNKFKVVMAWCYSPNNMEDFFVHFLNYNIETKEYYDDTLGAESGAYYYYIFKDSWLQAKVNGENPQPSNWLEILKQDFYDRYVTGFLEKKYIKAEDM